jgi:SpoVK/Ycf46/Vps4 family AAA+-type ATPase
VTNRCIKKADLTFKSKWYGESERNIKNLFVSYRKLLDTSELEPILLFDEVDGIFGTRKTLSSHSSIDQTENTIQNIILSEMSEFRGILFASSNLICNLDPAFERRFLYKIRLERPNSETRFLIWKDKLPQLGDDELRDLSENWDMSGAQIQNVSTKALMNQILTGKPFTLQEIRKLCESEFLVKKSERRPIGF